MKLFHQNKYLQQLSHRYNLNFAMHLHDALEFVWLRQGSCRVLTSAGSYLMEAGQLFISFPHQLHGYEDSQDVDAMLWIIPEKPYLDSYADVLSTNYPTHPILSVEPLLPLLELLFSEPKDVSAPILQGYAQLIIGKLLQLMPLTPATAGSADALQTILLYLADHYREDLSREEIAAAVGYNASYISHIFSNTLHITLTGYLNMLRLRDARQLLITTSTSVSQIALQLGFSSIRSFNRAFSAEMGCPPSAFRRSHRRLTP